ncbi:hypothetical protein DVH05_008910 [Phytophthora capsici]|nr:hypothetical protein DVH05_008910 [Phytophthora capsici]
MPHQRIPINYTLLFKVHTVDDWLEASARGESRKAFAKDRGIPPPTRSRGRPKAVLSKFRRRAIFDAAVDGLRCVSADTVSHAFIKGGPFVPFGPPNKSEELLPCVDTATHVLEEVVL